MSTTDLLQPLRESLDMVNELVCLAQSEDWFTLETESVKYQQKITFLNDDKYLQALSESNLVIEAKALIAQIQVLNDGLDVHTNTMRDKIASELRQIMQANKALDAYGQ